jgi:hypothetical protein
MVPASLLRQLVRYVQQRIHFRLSRYVIVARGTRLGGMARSCPHRSMCSGLCMTELSLRRHTGIFGLVATLISLTDIPLYFMYTGPLRSETSSRAFWWVSSAVRFSLFF